jgi:hypothetical protein
MNKGKQFNFKHGVLKKSKSSTNPQPITGDNLAPQAPHKGTNASNQYR